ncbi:MAG: lamin tail domain-containing protein [Patescibacteria group bacterium]
MLKKCYGLFLGLVVLAGSACVTPTHASSATIVITNIRAGSSVSAADEGVLVYNNSAFEVDVTHWCLTNKAQVMFACISPEANEKMYLPAYSNATIVSTKGAVLEGANAYAAVYEPANQSSGAIVASSDTISLINADNQIIDQYSWTSTLSSNQQWARISLTSLPHLTYLDTDATTDWQKVPYVAFPASVIEYRWPEEIPDEDGEVEEPTGPIEPSITPLPAIVTEILPNAIGSDTGNEFIELFNPNEDVAVQLQGYKLLVGPALEKVIILTEYILQPGEYKVLTNAEYSYSLLNTSSKVSLQTNAAVLASEVPLYDAPKEGESWANVNGTWQYTNRPTPGAENLLSNDVLSLEDDSSAENSTIKPCASNQYRSTETNRCRLLSSATASTQAACKEGQERNLETNRCRNIATTSEQTPCKEGQERNLETNRCRNIKALANAGYGVKGATVKQQGGMSWYMWAAIGGIVLLVIGYAVWEWRDELKKFVNAIKAKFARSAN